MNDIITSRLDKAYQLFFNALIKNDIASIVAVCYDVLGYPVFLTDDIANNLCQIPNGPIGNSQWDERFYSGGSSNSKFQYSYEKYIKNATSKQYPIFLYDEQLTTLNQLFSVLHDNEKIYGYVVILLPNSVPSEEDIQIAKLLNTALISLLSKEEKKNIHTLHSTRVVENLLSPQYEITSKLLSDINRLKLIYPPNYQLIFSTPKEKNYEPLLLERICADITSLKKDLLPLIFDSGIIILCSNQKNNDNQTIYNNNYLTSLKALLLDYSLISGSSDTFSDLLKLKVYYQQAALTKKAGERLNSSENYFSWEETLPMQIYYAVAEHYSSEVFLHPMIIKIYQYDQANKTDYLNTLKTYLFCNQNNRRAAKNLFIHTNTLLYRINRLSEFFNIDFKDQKLMHALFANFCLISYGFLSLDQLYQSGS